jgi:hypothetical protein
MNASELGKIIITRDDLKDISILHNGKYIKTFIVVKNKFFQFKRKNK